jgi:DNA-binding GntR family transcriptional regulator
VLFKNPTRQNPITTTDKVFEQMQLAIVEGEIPAGSKISEPELSKKFQAIPQLYS